MIPKEAFAAIIAVMVVSWVFGIFCDRMFNRWMISMWMPSDGGSEDSEIDLVMCKDCIYRDKTLYEEPCVSCTGGLSDKWEKDNR